MAKHSFANCKIMLELKANSSLKKLMTGNMNMSDQPEQTLETQLRKLRERTSAETTIIYNKSVQDLIATNIEKTALQKGVLAPDFTLPNATGQEINLSALLVNGPVVLTFYRGAWCPYCNIQLRAYQEILPQIHELGAELIAISPELPDGSLTITEKHHLAFPVLSDVNAVVLRQYKVLFTVPENIREIYLKAGLDIVKANGVATWELPIPATYIIDSDRVIRFAYTKPDYRERLEPKTLLEQVALLRK